jgi:hypothetical protein
MEWTERFTSPRAPPRLLVVLKRPTRSRRERRDGEKEERKQSPSTAPKPQSKLHRVTLVPASAGHSGNRMTVTMSEH